MGDIIPRKELTKQGTQGVSAIAGGTILLILRGLATGAGPFGWIVGGLLTLGGLAFMRSKEDRTAGGIVAGAGVLTLLSRIGIFPGISSFLMLIGGLGLLGVGGYSLYKFIVNLRKRR